VIPVEILQKNAMEQVRIWREPYKGHDLVHMRLFFQNDSGEWLPTRKGLVLRPELAKQAAEVLLGLLEQDN